MRLAGLSGMGPAILVVEDDPQLRGLMVQWLHLSGFAPITAPNGEEALILLRAGVPARVILLDLAMPVMDGWAFRRAQQGDARIAHIPVIVMTGMEKHDSSAIEPAATFTKPLDFDQLLIEVSTLCATASRGPRA